MTFTVDLNAETEEALLLQARARGVSLDAYLQDLLVEQASIGNHEPQRPLATGRGLLAKYGPAPSAEEIEENRREMFGSFARDF